MKLPLVAAFALSTLIACGGSDGPSTDHEGVYTVSSWTGNMTSCDGPAMPLDPPSSTARLYIQSTSIFGQGFINVAPCDDEAACQADAEDSTVHLSFLGWTFTKGSDSQGWNGSGGELVSENDDTCDGTSSVALMTFSGTTVHIVNRVSNVSWPKPSDGCSLEQLHEHAVGAACNSFTAVDATFATDL